MRAIGARPHRTHLRSATMEVAPGRTASGAGYLRRSSRTAGPTGASGGTRRDRALALGRYSSCTGERSLFGSGRSFSFWPLAVGQARVVARRMALISN